MSVCTSGSWHGLKPEMLTFCMYPNAASPMMVDSTLPPDDATETDPDVIAVSEYIEEIYLYLRQAEVRHLLYLVQWYISCKCCLDLYVLGQRLKYLGVVMVVSSLMKPRDCSRRWIKSPKTNDLLQVWFPLTGASPSPQHPGFFYVIAWLL